MEHPIRRNIARVGLTVGLLAGAGAAIGAYEGATTPTEIRVGPQAAEARLTFDQTYTLNFIGKATKPSNQPLIGVNVDAKDIPTQPGSTDDPVNIDWIVTQYKELFADPQHVLDQSKEAIVEHVEQDALTGALLGIGAASLLLFTWSNMSERRREHLYEGFKSSKQTKRVLWATVAAASLAVACGSGSAATPARQPVDTVDHVFDGTPLEGTSIQGVYLQSVVDQIAPQLINYIQTTGDFYDKAKANFEEAFAAREDLQNPKENVVRVLVLSDNHCNIGMDRVFGSVARKLSVNALIDPGDTTMGGSVPEEECVASEADSTPNTPKLLAPGNHDDSVVTGDQARKHGFQVVDGTTQEFAGFRVLGDSDPRRTGFGSGDLNNNDPRMKTLADSLANTACQDHPDILVVHDPQAALPTAQEHCATLTISGHTHVQKGPIAYSDSKGNINYSFTQGTSGGAKEDSIILGPLKNPAIMSVFEFDKTTRRPLGRYDIAINTDGSAEISNFIPISAATPN